MKHIQEWLGHSSYTLTADTTVDSGKTYYKKTVVDAVDGRLPLPDEVYEILTTV